jgi:hypothetical protein
VNIYMSIKIKRIQSVESGPFGPDGQRTRFTLDVPASVGFTDPTNSHVIFRMKAECTSNGVLSTTVPCFLSQTTGLYNASAGGGQVLIKNAKVMSKELGVLNEQPNQNVIGANLNEYTTTTSGKEANVSFTGQGSENDSLEFETTLPHSPFMTYSRPSALNVAQTTASIQRYTEVRIPMKHIDRYADGIKNFPNIAMGDMTYQVELEDVLDVVGAGNQLMGADDLEDMTAVASGVGSTGVIGSAANPLTYGEPTLAFKEDNFNQLPFYVGMPLAMTYTTPAGAGQTHSSYITSLKVNSASGLLEIVLAVPAPTANATDACTDITAQLEIDGAAVFTWTIQDVFLELHCLQLTPGQLELAKKALNNPKFQIPWYEYRLVKKNMGQTNDYSDDVLVSPNCAGFVVIMPANASLVGGYDNFRQYRFQMDGKLTTTRDVRIGAITDNTGNGIDRQLHNHMLQKWFGNLGKRLTKFDTPNLDYTSAGGADTHTIFPLVTPVVDRNILVGFKARTDTGDVSAREVYYLSIHPRVLTFKNGRAV